SSILRSKVPPGAQDERLQLYQKWHRPIIGALIANGTTTSTTVFALRSREFNGNYDFLIINVSPANPKPMPVSRGELIKQLFPDIEAYTASERRRWELTINHSDEIGRASCRETGQSAGD